MPDVSVALADNGSDCLPHCVLW